MKSGAALTAADITFASNQKSGDVAYTVGSSETITLKDYEAIAKVGTGTYTITNINGGSYGNTADAVNNILASLIGKFQYWNKGQTYYFTDIVHHSLDPNKLNGIIRNHYYNITISSITGLGTPVPTNPDTPATPDPEPDDTPETPDTTPESSIPTPEIPTDPDQPIIPETPTADNHSALVTEISVLQYRQVNQSVNLGQ